MPVRNARKDHLPLAMLAVVFALAVAACSNSPATATNPQTVLSADVAPGVILIDILQGGKPEHYWQYEIRPAAGSVRQVADKTFPDSAHEDIPQVFQQPAGAIEACAETPEANSPDGVYSARCTKLNSDEFFVNNAQTTETLHDWKPKEWRGIRGFAWAPNSRSVAILNLSEYYGKGPLESLSAAAGHPIPHDTVLLDVLDVGTGKVTEYVVRRNVVYAFTRILAWSDAK